MREIFIRDFCGSFGSVEFRSEEKKLVVLRFAFFVVLGGRNGVINVFSVDVETRGFIVGNDKFGNDRFVCGVTCRKFVFFHSHKSAFRNFPRLISRGVTLDAVDKIYVTAFHIGSLISVCECVARTSGKAQSHT